MRFLTPYSLKQFSPRARRDSSNPPYAPSFFFFLQKIPPAVLALLIQLFTGVFIIVLFRFFTTISTFFSITWPNLPWVLPVVLQAGFASFFAQKLKMATWWRVIHFFFPILVWLMLMFDVPNSVYLVGFVVTLSVYWSTYRTQVPYYPSRVDVWQRMSDMVKSFPVAYQRDAASLRMIDIGSGLGGLSLYIAKHHSGVRVEGVEIAPLPWLVSKLRAIFQTSNARFTLGDYHRLNFSDYDIVFAYLSPAAMPALWEKAQKEMRKNTLLVSLEFAVPEITPHTRLPQKGQNRELFIYKI